MKISRMDTFSFGWLFGCVAILLLFYTGIVSIDSDSPDPVVDTAYGYHGADSIAVLNEALGSTVNRNALLLNCIDRREHSIDSLKQHIEWLWYLRDPCAELELVMSARQRLTEGSR